MSIDKEEISKKNFDKQRNGRFRKNFNKRRKYFSQMEKNFRGTEKKISINEKGKKKVNEEIFSQ